jgi:hypothetical protein
MKNGSAGFRRRRCRRSAASILFKNEARPQRSRACCPTRSARICGDLPRPPPGSTVLAARFRWRRAKGACHRLISGTPPACSLCGRVVVIPVKPALGNRPSRVGLPRCRRSAARHFNMALLVPRADARGYTLSPLRGCKTHIRPRVMSLRLHRRAALFPAHDDKVQFNSACGSTRPPVDQL